MKLHLPKVLLTVVLACFSFATPSLAGWSGNTYTLEGNDVINTSGGTVDNNFLFIRDTAGTTNEVIETLTFNQANTDTRVTGVYKNDDGYLTNLTIKSLVINESGTGLYVGGSLKTAAEQSITIDSITGNNDLSNLVIETKTSLTLKDDVTVTNELKVAANSTLKLANNASLKIDGTRGIISKGSTAGADGSANIMGNNSNYTLTNTFYEIHNARVEVSNENVVAVSNILKNVDLVNNGTGTLTTTNGNNDYATISALTGDIILEGLAATANTGNVDTINALTIGANRTLSVYTKWHSQNYTEANEATLLVAANGTASFGSGAKLNGNLVLSSGVTVSMDSALTMGSDLTLSEGMTLDGDVLTSVMALGAGEKVNLFTGVDTLYLGASAPASGILTEDNRVLLGTYFNFAGVNDTYYLGYDADGNVYAGVIAPPPVDPTPGDNVPEPTTATLSLLALAGLAARRRRR